MKKILTILITIILSEGIFGQEISVRMLDSLIANFSVAEILAGNYDEAEKKIRSIEYSDSGLFYLALGEIASRRGEREKAIMNFVISAEISERVAPFAFRKLGDMELASGNLAYAVSAYRIAAQKTTFENYRHLMFSKVDSLKNVFPDSLGSVIWAVVFWDDPRAAGGVFEESPTEIIERALADRKLTADLFDSLYAFAKENSIDKRFLTRISDTTIADSTINARKAFEIANEMFEQKLFSGASNWLHLSMNRPNFSSQVQRRRLLAFRTQLNFSMSNWANVIKFGEEFMRHYGETSEILFNVGRAYRRSGNLTQAHRLYERHIRLYPNNRTTHDILWYMAWVREEQRDFDTAQAMFRRMANQRPVGRRGEEAGFRIGLIDFRRGRYDAALREFANFRRMFPSSAFVSASLYWTARTQTALGDTAAAKQTISTINTRHPLTYYDFLSREIFGDTTTIDVVRISDSLWLSRIDALPITEARGAPSNVNIDNLLLGIFLGSLGLSEEAELLFEPIENRNSRNFPMVLTLSRFYSNIGAHFRSYRLARRLFWALPANQRSEFSPEFVELFYPTRAFASEVDRFSERFNVERQLVRAVMRQESMFSPTILSPVGAMGLMQVMPATGREIAQELRVPFDQTKLLTPETNVEFGTYYLGKRLRQFNGNMEKATAAYNGGAHNVNRWIERNRDMLDDIPLFVEHIGFAETRQYVKIVMENYWIYKRIQE